MAPISIKKNLFKDTDRKCLHIELDITGSRLRYEAGDHVAIYPQNDPLIVNEIGMNFYFAYQKNIIPIFFN